MYPPYPETLQSKLILFQFILLLTWNLLSSILFLLDIGTVILGSWSVACVPWDCVFEVWNEHYFLFLNIFKIWRIYIFKQIYDLIEPGFWGFGVPKQGTAGPGWDCRPGALH